MTSINQIYKCEICGNIIEVLHEGADALVCCGQPMELKKENTEGEYAEKHAPVIEGNKVKIGSVEHPMEEEHYIEWIEIKVGKNSCKHFLKPGEKPEATFKTENISSARMYCNKHGLWKNE